MLEIGIFFCVVGFVYYEVDCFWFLKNPYIPLDVSEPTMAVESQNDLVGDGRQEAVHEKEELTEDDKGGRGIQLEHLERKKIRPLP